MKKLKEKTMSKLKHCPFCGGKAEIYKNENGYFVQCTKCGISKKFYSTISIAKRDWNKRVDITALK